MRAADIVPDHLNDSTQRERPNDESIPAQLNQL